MRPFYYGATTNFGDHMNSWLWPELTPELLAREDDIRLIGIGSLLSRNLDLVAGPKVVFGTGSGYSSLPTKDQAAAWDVRCVRGPLTARHLGLAPEKAITDGAWLINQIPRYAEVPTTRKGTVFVPHWSTASYGNWGQICAQSDLTYVDPFADCDTVFGALARAELAIVESLHGAIIADFYRTPWIPVASPKRILKYKWLDWCQSLGLEYQPYLLPPSDYVDHLLQGEKRQPISTTPVSISVPLDTFDVLQTAPAPRKPGLTYKARMQAKTVLRKGRTVALEALARGRNTAPFRSWNARHTDRMQTYFETLKGYKPHLSRDDIRATRIDQLNTALDLMKQDYS